VSAASGLRVVAMVFDGITPLDVVGPLEVFSRVPRVEIALVGSRAGVASDPRTKLVLQTPSPFSEVTSADVLIIPGGPGVRALCDDLEFLGWLRAVHETTQLTTSVCTGALCLAAAGLLHGLDATTHWAHRAALEQYGATYLAQRFVRSGKIITAAGVSAGIDMCLYAIAELYGETLAKAVQLSIEYDPQPPFDSGSPAKAGSDMTERVRAAIARA